MRETTHSQHITGWGLTALLALGACSPTSVEAQVDDGGGIVLPATNGTTAALLQASVTAPYVNHFRGDRMVKLYQVAPGVEYREEVGADGNGMFAVDTLEVISAHPDPTLFMGLQDSRETLTYRHRDFHIKDYNLFMSTYQVLLLEQQGVVAGQPTERLRIERISGATCYYIVDFDQNTGLVLAYQEYDLQGQLLSDVYYETIEYEADLSGMALVDYLYPTSVHPVGVGSPFTFEPLVPDYVPAGYVLQPDLEKQEADKTWAKVYLTDGLETVIFSSAAPVLIPGIGTSSRVSAMNLGTWTGIMGEVDGYPVIVAGKLDTNELRAIIQSAF